MNLYTTAVNLPEKTRVEVIQALNQALADTTDLQSQAKFAHWNVKGYDFYQLHLLFDEIAEVLSEHVDTIAERITALGGQAMGTTRIAADASRLPEPPENAVEEEAYLEWLTDHVAHHANGLRMQIDRAAELGDEDTADLFTELSREVDEQLYFLESHLQSDVEKQVPATASRAKSGIAGGSGAQGSQSGGTKIEIQPDGNRAFGEPRSGPRQSSRGTSQQPGAQQSGHPAPGMPRDSGQPAGTPPSTPQSGSRPTGPPPERGQSFGEQSIPQEPGQQHGFQQGGSNPTRGPPGGPMDIPQSDVHGGAPAHEAATSTPPKPPGEMER